MHHRSQRDEKHPPERRPPVHHLHTQSVCERENARERARVCGNTRARARAARTHRDEDGRGRGKKERGRPPSAAARGTTPSPAPPWSYSTGSMRAAKRSKTHFFLLSRDCLLPFAAPQTIRQICPFDPWFGGVSGDLHQNPDRHTPAAFEISRHELGCRQQKGVKMAAMQLVALGVQQRPGVRQRSAR